MTYFELSIIIVTLGMVGITAFGVLTTKKPPKSRLKDIDELIVCVQKLKELSEQISMGLSDLAQSVEEQRKGQENISKPRIT